MRITNRKHYEPVTDFERRTSYAPLYLAWHVLDEVRHYFRAPTPEAFAGQLARRAETVFAHHPFWQRRFQSAGGREAILASMRHWLAGVLARERPALFRDLPEHFKVGHPLPVMPRTVEKPSRGPATSRPQRQLPRGQSGRTRPTTHLVHGCELLAV
jgi:hypothetical protein